MTNTNEITLPWVRIWGPEKVDPGTLGMGDYIVGDYGWQSAYGCGTSRAIISYALNVRSDAETWGNDDAGEPSSRAWVSSMTELYSIAGLDSDGDEVHNEDHEYEYEDVSLLDYERSDYERAYAALDMYGTRDDGWAFCPLTFDQSQAGADDPSRWAAERTVMENRLTSHYRADTMAS